MQIPVVAVDSTQTMAFELAVELAVDLIAVNTELKRKGIPIDQYYALLTRETLLCQTFFFAVPTFATLLFCFSSGPMVWFCSSAVDPCTCVGGPYRLYRPLCSFLALGATDRAAIFNSFANATEPSISIPGLQEAYLKEFDMGNATNYTLDLDAIRAEHPLLLSFLSVRNRELIIAAALTLILVIGGMFFFEEARDKAANAMATVETQVVASITNRRRQEGSDDGNEDDGGDSNEKS